MVTPHSSRHVPPLSVWLNPLTFDISTLERRFGAKIGQARDLLRAYRFSFVGKKRNLGCSVLAARRLTNPSRLRVHLEDLLTDDLRYGIQMLRKRP